MAKEDKQVVNELTEEPTNLTSRPKLEVKFGGFLSRFLPPEVEHHESMDANQMAEVRTNLATKRTLMAADRTLMAWVRTALSMISFGFTIYKILQGFQSSGGGIISSAHKYDPQTIGLLLIGMGIFSTVLGTVEYWQTLKELRLIQHIQIWRPSFIIALIISAIGMWMFFSIIAEVV